VPVRLELKAWVDEQEARLTRAVARGVDRRKERLKDLARVLPRADALLFEPRQRLDRADELLRDAPKRLIERKSATFAAIAGGIRPATLKSRLSAERSRLHDRARRLEPASKRMITVQKDRILGIERLLRSLGYKETLARGYAVVWAGEKVVTGVVAAKAVEALEIEFQDGRLDVATESAGSSKKRKDGGADQGSLF